MEIEAKIPMRFMRAPSLKAPDQMLSWMRAAAPTALREVGRTGALLPMLRAFGRERWNLSTAGTCPFDFVPGRLPWQRRIAIDLMLLFILGLNWSEFDPAESGKHFVETANFGSWGTLRTVNSSQGTVLHC